MGSLDFDYPETSEKISVLERMGPVPRKFYLCNRSKINLRYKENKSRIEYQLKDKKLMFFYYRFCKGHGNIDSIKNVNSVLEQGTCVILNKDEFSELANKLIQRKKENAFTISGILLESFV